MRYHPLTIPLLGILVLLGIVGIVVGFFFRPVEVKEVQSETWWEFEPQGEGFRAELPSKPMAYDLRGFQRLVDSSVQIQVGWVPHSDSGNSYACIRTRFPCGSEANYDAIRRGMASFLPGIQFHSQKTIHHQHMNGEEVTFSLPDGRWGVIRMYSGEDRGFGLIVWSEDLDQSAAMRFFDSFRLTE